MAEGSIPFIWMKICTFLYKILSVSGKMFTFWSF